MGKVVTAFGPGESSRRRSAVGTAVVEHQAYEPLFLEFVQCSCANGIVLGIGLAGMHHFCQRPVYATEPTVRQPTADELGRAALGLPLPVCSIRSFSW